MPKPTSRHPEQLRPYIAHGLPLEYSAGSDEATCDCPFCEREGKFSVNVQNGKWQCWGCNENKIPEEGETKEGGGNILTFIRQLWKESEAQTTDYRLFSEERRLMYPDTLMAWGLAQSKITGEWLVPAYDLKGEKLMQLYRYARVGNDRITLAPTSLKGFVKAENKRSHQLLGTHLYKKRCSTIYLCEGVWDAMILWEVLKGTKETDKGLAPTGSKRGTMLSDANVLAVPGCKVFFTAWESLFAGKIVNLMFDNDHPLEKGGKTQTPAARQGMERVAAILRGAGSPPKKMAYLKWGEGGFDPNRPSGYDLRDFFSEAKAIA